MSSLKKQLEDEADRRLRLTKELSRAKSEILLRDNQLMRARARLSEYHAEKDVKFTQRDTEELIQMSQRLKNIAGGIKKRSEFIE